MKEFERWNKEEHRKDLEMYGARPSRSEERQKGWKAALEWAENQFVGKSAFEAEEAINKELRD